LTAIMAGPATRFSRFLVASIALALSCVAGAGTAAAQKKTVCTVTVNSPDEKEAFRKALGLGRYDFVELVEHGRPDWLESACRSGVRCDVLVVSGHYDGGNEFFSDRTEAREYLPVDELERVSCNGSCPGLFSQLKEVYLFGCDSLNPQANASLAGEVGRSLQRAGLSRGEAERIARSLAARHAESARDRMRLIFKDVPAIYGFSAVAPLGPTAGSLLRRHFQAGGAADVGTGRVSGRLLSQFSAHAMTVTSGLGPNDPLLAHRQDVCEFANDRVPPEQRVDFVHRLFEREIAEARMFLTRLESFADGLPPPDGRSPALASSLHDLANDGDVRARYLELARDADAASTRARMIAVGGQLGWLTPSEERDELAAMFEERLARNAVTPVEVDLACSLNRDGVLEGLDLAAGDPARVSHAALLACLGDAGARERVLHALTSSDEQDVRFAQVVLSYRPLDQRQELPAVMNEIGGMTGRDAQVRALHALASQRLSDPQSLAELVRLYPRADSSNVQAAIANVLLRSDYRSIASADVVHTLRTSRMRAGGGEDAVDVLIRRMQAHVQ
jgi:hypothetical protein